MSCSCTQEKQVSHVAPVKSSSLSVSTVSTCPTTSELGHVTVYRETGLRGWGWLRGGGARIDL